MPEKREQTMTDDSKFASSPEPAGSVAARMVPVEPTEEMVRCGWNAYLEDMEGGRERFAKTYRAMLAAAPASAPPPAGAQQAVADQDIRNAFYDWCPYDGKERSDLEIFSAGYRTALETTPAPEAAPSVKEH